MTPFVATADVVRIASRITNISVDDIRSGKRHKPISRARAGICYVVKELFPARSYPSIAQWVGCKDHSSVVCAIRRAKELIERDDTFAAYVRKLAWHVRGLPVPKPVNDVSRLVLPEYTADMDSGQRDEVSRHRGSILLLHALRGDLVA